MMIDKNHDEDTWFYFVNLDDTKKTKRKQTRRPDTSFIPLSEEIKNTNNNKKLSTLMLSSVLTLLISLQI